jgi:hypothetical protein
VRKLFNEELYDRHFSPGSIRVIKLSRMGRAGHVVCVRVERNVCKVLVGKPEGNSLLEVLGITGWIRLRRILRKYD